MRAKAKLWLLIKLRTYQHSSRRMPVWLNRVIMRMCRRLGG